MNMSEASQHIWLDCVSAVSEWLTNSDLQLNSKKKEVLIVGPIRKLKCDIKSKPEILSNYFDTLGQNIEILSEDFEMLFE